MRPVQLSVAAGLALAAASTFAPAPASARTAFDGNWSVLIQTNSGPCDRGYRYGLSIQNGVVIYEGSAPVNVAGRVTGKGSVSVRLWSGQSGASGKGRLSRNEGGGNWRGTGSMGTCAGTWTAERR